MTFLPLEVDPDTRNLSVVVGLAFAVILGLAWLGIISQGVAFVVIALFAGFALYGYVLMKEGDYDELD